MSRFFMVFIFLFTTLYAEQETYPFIGVTFSTQTIDLKPIAHAPPNLLENPNSETENVAGIQYGVQTKDFRTTFTLEGNSNYQSIDVEVDYILMDEMFGMPEIRPYIGGTLGYINYDEDIITRYNANRIADDLENDRNTSISTSDGYYGLDFGFLFYITDNIDLDVSYHYYFMDRLEPLDTLRGASFSLHYFY